MANFLLTSQIQVFVITTISYDIVFLTHHELLLYIFCDNWSIRWLLLTAFTPNPLKKSFSLRELIKKKIHRYVLVVVSYYIEWTQLDSLW